ncbi:MAG: cell division protein ZapA [Elusimicrobiota bacterium]|nr:cell division protein ZapA [Elusimicrobiota bacterium]
MKEKVPVQILGKTYLIETDLTQLQLQAIATYVEEKLREASSNTDTQVPSQIAILTALNIADELFRLQTEHENLLKTVDKKTDELITLIDRSLE